jgi:hypothetical protein
MAQDKNPGPGCLRKDGTRQNFQHVPVDDRGAGKY